MKSGIVIHYFSPRSRLVLRWTNTTYSIVEERCELTPKIKWIPNRDGFFNSVGVIKKEYMEKIAKIVLELEEKKK